MASQALDIPPVPQLIRLVAQSLQPTSIADCVALAIAAVIVTGYLTRGALWDKPDPYYHIYFERPQQRNGAANSQAQAQRNIAKTLSETDKKAVIFWGSQSGTAERFASQLAKEVQSRFGLGALSADLSDYDPESITQLSNGQLAIFILSTYGEGDPSDNANAFWGWISNGLQSTLPNLQYAAFGLGNSNYKYYNRVVDVVVQALNRKGANLFLPVGKADDAERSTDEDFLAWKDDLFGVFRKRLGMEEQVVEYQPTIVVTEDDSLTPIDLHHGEPNHSRDNPKAAMSCSPIRPLSITNPRELFQSSERNCVHMELDLAEHPEIHYKTGDHLAIWPTNPESEVKILLTVLQLHDRQDTPISLKSVDAETKLQIPTPTTIRALFHRYLEICAPVSRSTIQGLASFAPTPYARSRVLKLGQDKDFYLSYLRKNHLTFGRLLKFTSPDEPWAKLPLPYLIEALPLMQPRYYSISSSSVLSPRRAAITALVATDYVPENREQKIHGVTSNYLLALSQSHPALVAAEMQTGKSIRQHYDLSGPSNLLQGTKLFAHVRKSKFKLPIQSSCPIVMVAAGTGIAPFRAFIAERAKLHAIGKPIGQMILFFGCRRPQEDFIYREELEQTQATVGKEVFKIFTAFSRMQGQDKVHVQQCVREYGGEVISLIEEKSASFYICGRASMAREVGFSLGEAMREIKGWTDFEVKSWTERLKRTGKWKEDVWG
ncbi:NADPH-ferrihemoprotein reductase [Cladophialophora psammophila CBS 110553]|uniref:NADPH--cytochrome P450 reductase n=1 Tax=Cladophialophora psammophila CBS 110553 TaxID=1182543 RepID=W9VN33_9EURO|nr:NADPH-ferrihemoprotein reductase [Cladophialophora psammophila CBS 110553]EXJ53541.1 NADPH-ferrihemoprotein reductase [Cladophialophora psammophila CBS 110553]